MVNSQVHHITLNVSDLAEAKDFYSYFFSLQELKKPGRNKNVFWLEASDGRQIHLRKGDVPEDKGQHLAFLVSDIIEACNKFIEAGITVTTPSPIGTGLQAFVHDPSGNRIEIHQVSDLEAEA